MRRNYFLLILVIVLRLAFIEAQNFTFYHYGLDDGLSQETVRTILKDSSGFLWLGTQDGLNRFDGTSFTVYKNQKKDSLTISGNFINTLTEDNDGNIWIGTNDNGISIYDSQINSFRSTAIRSGNCSSLSKTSTGTIIAIILNEGIVVFVKKGENYSYRKIAEINGKKFQFNKAFVKNDILYVSTQDGRLFISRNILSDHITFSEITLDKSVRSINTLFVHKDNIWLGTSNGLFVFNTNKKQLSKILLEENIERNESLYISSINIHNDTFYIGTYDGLFVANYFNDDNLKFQKIVTYKGEQSDSNSITSSRVYDTFTDGNLLWIGTNNLDVVTLTEPVFKNINTTSSIVLNNAFILSFAKKDDYLFVGTRKGINCIDPNGEVTYITKENTEQALAFNVIRSMSVDKNNYLWIGTIKGASIIDLNNFNPKSPKVISFYHDSNNSKSLSSDATRGVFIDHKGTVWIMTYGGGVNRFTGDIKNNIITFEHYKTDTNSISSDFTYNMSQDKDLNYWITSEDGLNKLQFEDSNYQKPKFTSYFHDKNDSTSLSSNTTLHTWHDANKVLWVATQDGFDKFNSKDETFTRYGKEDGLTNTFVYSITEDKNNDLWLTTNSGLFRFNKTNEQFTNYNQGDGVQSSEFNLGAHFYNQDTNEIYVGGINGFNIFNPRKVPQLDLAGNLTFTSLRIKDRVVNPVTNYEIIKQSITKTDEITLNHTDFPCYISFSDLDLRPTKNNQFVYSLNDTDWNNLTDSREIPLLDLPKGRHSIKIQGKSRHNLWQKPPLELDINVIPPWYQSNMAYLMYLLLFLAIVYAFYTISLQRQIAGQESKRLKDLDDLKSRLITNITHEFRTPLTIILGYLGNLKERFSNKDDINTSLQTIEQNSNNLLNLVNQMLDLTKLEQGSLSINMIQNDMVDYIKHLINSFSGIANEKSIALEFESEEEALLMDFDTEKMRQIITNLISNAIKFSSEDSTVTIHLKREKDIAFISIEDQGVGISDEELPHIFDRFFQVENQGHKVSQGTGIGLALTKELVNLLNGTITVTSKVNKGTTFTMTLPITNSAEKTDLELLENHIKTGSAFVPETDDVITQEDTNSVLIVEDNRDMARYIASCLQPQYSVTFAKNGLEGFEKAQQLIPDIIITDVMMPVMDGFELTQKLQSQITTNHIPIIMLTSKATHDDKMEGIFSGADAYLTKPFEKQELLLRMQMLISKRERLQKSYAIDNIKNRTAQEIPDKNMVFLNQVIAIIHDHIEDSSFNANQLAKTLAMSDSQLYRKLKAISNSSTSIFIRKVRLEKSKELLKTTSLSISEVAYATGFNDPNWFSKAFKEAFNMSPTAFRN